jgi:hypothetical protein
LAALILQISPKITVMQARNQQICEPGLVGVNGLLKTKMLELCGRGILMVEKTPSILALQQTISQ